MDSEKVYCRPFKHEKKWPFEITLQTIIFKNLIFYLKLIFYIYLYYYDVLYKKNIFKNNITKLPHTSFKYSFLLSIKCYEASCGIAFLMYFASNIFKIMMYKIIFNISILK
jgi:hypothetical protein